MTTQPPQSSERGVRALAFYLPQFHPIPENDAWWGPGFTDWLNVVRARPLFDGHYQPHLPADLGFCDLRLPEVREAQAVLARAHGIGGFVYYHYWFGGHRLLERPFEEVLRSGRPDFPFALCWANEPWSRRWDGRHADVLVPQEYGESELERHAAWLVRAFADPRYIRVRGRPLFVVYEPEAFPGEAGEYLGRLRGLCAAEGAEPYLVQAETHNTTRAPADNGCDAEVEFHPHRLWELAPRLHDDRYEPHAVFDYAGFAQRHSEREQPEWDRYRCVVPAWDNTPRRAGGLPATLLLGAEPDAYGAWLAAVAEREGEREEGLVFLNAWNEWAEGAHLEPDLHHGRGYLEATRAVFGGAQAPAEPAPGAADWDAAAAYHDLHERYVQTQRDREADLRRGQEAAGKRIEELERELAVFRKVADDYQRLAEDERRARVEAEEWARRERRARGELEALLAGGDGSRQAPAWRRRAAGAAGRLRAAVRKLRGA